jgi:hypothetical protein
MFEKILSVKAQHLRAPLMWLPICLSIYLSIDSYSVPAAFCAAMPGMTSVADSGHSADVDPRRPTSSLERDHLSPKTCRHTAHSKNSIFGIQSFFRAHTVALDAE